MTTVDIVEPNHSQALLRSYVERSKQIALEQQGALEEYSPLAHSLLLSGIESVNHYTPGFVKNLACTGIEQLDSYVESADDMLGSVLERTEDFPAFLSAVQQHLTLDQLTVLVSELKNNVTSDELAKLLPSARLENFEMKKRVQEIVQVVASQPQLFKEKATDAFQSLDIDEDGKVSVLDLAGNAYSVSSGVATYCSALLSNVVGPLPTQADVSSLVENLMNSPHSQSVIDTLAAPLARTQELRALLQPLLSATELLKEYVSMYATNVKDHFNPLTPYLIALIAETSVIDLPIELYRLTKNTAGFGSDADSSKVAHETRALFWALIDISFLLEAMKQSEKNIVEAQIVEGMTMEKDADALKDGAWARGFSQMDFS